MNSKKELYDSWLKFKKQEQKAREKRLIIEKILCDIYEEQVSGNSKTFADMDYSITVKRNFVYSLDQEAYKSIRDIIPDGLKPEKVTFSLDLNKYKYLHDHNKEFYKKLSDCVTLKQNKTGIKVEKIK